MRSHRRCFVALAAALVSLTTVTACATTSSVEGSGGASGENWPAGPITIVLPTDPGASVDRLNRIVEPYLSDELGVPVRTEYRPGGDFAVGMDYYQSLPADGQTIFMFAEPYFTGTRIRTGASLDDWAFLGALNDDGVGIMANTKSDVDSLETYIEELRSGKDVTVGVLGGDPGILGFHLLSDVLDLPQPNYVTYQDGGELRLDFVGNHVQVISANHDGFLPLQQQGEGKFLGFYTAERYDDLPDVPLVGEVVNDEGADSGDIPVFPYYRFWAVQSSMREEYPDRFDRLVDALRTVEENPDFQAEAEKQTFVPSWTGPEEVTSDVRDFQKIAEQYKDVFSSDG